MPFTRLASFPNSRVKNRAPTRVSETSVVDFSTAPTEGVPFLISAAKADRTRISIINKTAGRLKYGYSDSDTVAPAMTNMKLELVSGMAIDTDSLQAIWGVLFDSVIGEIQIDEGRG